jgi:two-component system, sensor histidine kinase YesM
MRFLKKSIKTRLIFIFIVCAILPFLVQSLVVNGLYAGKLEEKLNEASILGLRNLSWEVGLNIQKMLGLSGMYTSNSQLKSFMAETLRDPSGPDGERLRTALTEMIATSRRDSDIQIHISIVARDGKVYSDLRLGAENEKAIARKVFGDPWYEESLKSQGSAIWLGVRDSYGPFETGKAFYLARHLVRDGEYVGTVLVSIDDYMFYRIFDKVKISADSRIYMADKQGRILLMDNEENLDSRLLGNLHVDSLLRHGSDLSQGYQISASGLRYYLISFCSMPEFDWDLVSITPETSVLKEMNGIRVIPIVLLALMLALLLFFALILNREIFIPVAALCESLKEVRRGNLDISISLPYDNEIGELGMDFNKMTADLKLYIRRIQEEEEQKRRLEVKALESQIKPHFIYNTLNSIKWMAEIQNAKSISDAIVAMVSLIEYNVGNQGIFVSVSAEAEALKNYVYLQQLRYWKSFEADFSIAEDTLGLFVPKLSLQPIVENAIVHGLSSLSRAGRLWISSALSEGGLLFRISDNGVGMDAVTLEGLLREGRDEDGLRRRGVGIMNVYQRIKLRYGDPYGLSISSAQGLGTEVRLLFPIIRESGEEGFLDENNDRR